MKDRYSFTREGLERIALAGVEPTVVWSVLHSRQRLLRHLPDSTAAIFGVAGTGQHVVVAIAESVVEDNDWDITGARLMDGDEIAAFTLISRRQQS